MICLTLKGPGLVGVQGLDARGLRFFVVPFCRRYPRVRIGVVGGDAEDAPIFGEDGLSTIIGRFVGVLRFYIQRAWPIHIGYVIFDGVLKVFVERANEELIRQTGKE